MNTRKLYDVCLSIRNPSPKERQDQFDNFFQLLVGQGMVFSQKKIWDQDFPEIRKKPVFKAFFDQLGLNFPEKFPWIQINCRKNIPPDFAFSGCGIWFSGNLEVYQF